MGIATPHNPTAKKSVVDVPDRPLPNSLANAIEKTQGGKPFAAIPKKPMFGQLSQNQFRNVAKSVSSRLNSVA